MYKKILVPLDGSAFAECTLEHVKAIAAGCDAEHVTLLLVIEPLPVGQFWETTGFSFTEAEKKAEEAYRNYLSQKEGLLKEQGINVKVVMVKGKAADSIIDFIKKNSVDLIIMSTHGRSGPSRWALGSVADHVLRASPVPVLIVTPAGCRVDG